MVLFLQTIISFQLRKPKEQYGEQYRIEDRLIV